MAFITHEHNEMRNVNLIWAQSQNGIIGKEGKIPWQNALDMQYFRDTTMHGTVIMGRKTWESLPVLLRPLFGRSNIIITRQENYKAKGALVVNSLADALQRSEADRDIWIIGGGEIYAQALELGIVEDIYLTMMEGDYEGDTYAPQLRPGDWVVTLRRESYLTRGTQRTKELSFLVLTSRTKNITENIWWHATEDNVPIPEGEGLRVRGPSTSGNREIIAEASYCGKWLDSKGQPLKFTPTHWSDSFR